MRTVLQIHDFLPALVSKIANFEISLLRAGEDVADNILFSIKHPIWMVCLALFGVSDNVQCQVSMNVAIYIRQDFADAHLRYRLAASLYPLSLSLLLQVFIHVLGSYQVSFSF